MPALTSSSRKPHLRCACIHSMLQSRSLNTLDEDCTEHARFAIPALTGCGAFRTGNGCFCLLSIVLHIGRSSISLVSCRRHHNLHKQAHSPKLWLETLKALIPNDTYGFQTDKCMLSETGPCLHTEV